MNEIKQAVWDALKQYHSVQRLSQSSLAVGSLMEGVTWNGDARTLHGYALRGAFLWALQLLGNGNHFERQSAETLQLRYVAGWSVAQCMAELHVVKGAINARQRKGIERVAALLTDAMQQGEVGLAERQRLAVAARYAACSADSRPQLHLWSVFREPVALEAANALATPLQPHLADLIELNWIIQSADGRVQLHPSGVAYVRQKLDAEERRAYHTCAAEFYECKNLFETAIYHWQQAHQDNRAAALLFEQQETFTALTLNHLLDGFDGGRLSADNQAQHQLLKGQVMSAMQDLDTAIDAYEQALQTSNPLTRAQACYGMAKLYESRDVTNALRYYEQSRIFVAQCVGETAERLQIRIWIDEAWVFINQKSELERAEANLVSAETPLNPAWSDLRIDLDSAWGEFYMRQVKLADCLDARWRAWFKANEIQDMRRMILAGYNLADTLVYAQQINEAWRMVEKVEKLATSAGDQRMVARCHKTLGNLCVLNEGGVASALLHYQRAYDYFVTVKDRHWQGVVCYEMADAYLMNGEPEKASHFIEEGLTIAHELGDKRLEEALQSIMQSHPALTAGLSARQRTIMWEVVQVGEIRTKQCMVLTGLERRQAIRTLQDLEALQILKKIGKGRGTRYILISDADHAANAPSTASSSDTPSSETAPAARAKNPN